MSPLNNYRKSYKSDNNTLNETGKDVTNRTPSLPSSIADKVDILPTQTTIPQTSTLPETSSDDSFTNANNVHQGVIDFLIIIGILMGMTIIIGIIINVYVYRKRIICKQSSISSSNSRRTLMTNNYKIR